MLPKINRIKKKKDFEAIFKNSKSFKSPLFVLKVAKNNLDINRLGLVVSQKISKRAVVRNKVRRRLSEIMKDEVKKIKNGKDIILIAFSGIEKKEFSEIKDTVTNSLIKSGLYLKK